MMPAHSFDPDFASPAQFAAEYRRHGLQVVPAKMPTEDANWKRPHLANWIEFQQAIASDAVFGSWYGDNGKEARRPNMGMIAGTCSDDIFVVDLDVHKKPQAAEWWRVLLEMNHTREPETWHQVTGGGGRQLFFRAPPGWRPPVNATPIGVDIRGQTGFAILPPSRHDSGREYDWAPGHAPWDIDCAVAPEWLVDAIDELVEQHGGHQPQGQSGERTERTATPAFDRDAFGHIIDGREAKMRNVIWQHVVRWRMECPIPPSETESVAAMLEAYRQYERDVGSRLEGTDKGALLDREGRGPREFERKWRRAMGMWHHKVAAEGERWKIKDEQEALRATRDAPIPEAVLAKPEEPATDGIDRGIATPFEWVDPSFIPPRAWIYGRHYIRKFVSTTVAPGGVGKTALGVVEALAITSGKPLLGITPEEQTSVWLWNGEDPLEELQRRVMAAAVHYGMAPSDIAGRLFVDTGRVTPIVIAEKTRDGATINVPVVEKVVHTIRANKIGLMIIDPFVACHRVTENDNSEIERVAKAWAQIADATNCAIELVHHVRKTNGNEVSVEDGRGATALLAAARSARALNRMTPDEAARAGIKEPGLYFRTDNGKANLAPPSAVATWYHLASLDLDNDTPATSESPARPSDKVGVVTLWEWPDPTSDVTHSDMEMVRAAVREGMWRADIQAKDWVGKCVIQTLGFDGDDEANEHKAKALIAMWLKSGALETYKARDPATRKDKDFIRAGKFKD